MVYLPEWRVPLINNGMERLKCFSRYGLYVLIVLLFFTACAPIPYSYSVDVKKESKIGSKLGLDKFDIMIGAIIGDVTSASDSIIVACIANGMAHKLESNMEWERESIPVMMISRDVLDVNDLYSRIYLMESERKSAIIVVDSLEVGYKFRDENLYGELFVVDHYGDAIMDTESSVKITIYDNSSAKPLYSYIDIMVLNINIPSSDVIEVLGDKTKLAKYILNSFSSYGEKLAEKLTFAWQWVNRTIYMDAGNREWRGAFSHMDDFEFDKAIDVWLKFISSKSSIKLKAIAAYNIAVACELTENYELALKWLDYSGDIYKGDNIHKVREINKLRKKIEERMESSSI